MTRKPVSAWLNHWRNSLLTTIIAVVLVLGGLIFFHELGHFLVARSLGMGVSVFSLGFGPKLLKYKAGKTEYALSLIPLGGYVALVGESNENDLPEGFSKEESFALRPAWQRLLVVAAGPAANILLAWLLCWILAFGWGTPVLLPDVGAVSENSPGCRCRRQGRGSYSEHQRHAGAKLGGHVRGCRPKRRQAYANGGGTPGRRSRRGDRTPGKRRARSGPACRNAAAEPGSDARALRCARPSSARTKQPG